MSIYVTGDTHGSMGLSRLKNSNLKRLGIELTKNDYLIICGDFGIPWKIDYNNQISLNDKWWLDWLEKKEYTILFVDGNHENHDYLDSLQVKQWNGGRVNKLADNVIHLMRGEIYNIEGKTFFTFGGATSIDKIYRTEGVSWWQREIASYNEMEHGMLRLENVGFTVDYIITHTVPSSITNEMFGFAAEMCDVSRYLELILERVTYKTWYCGHMHTEYYFERPRINLLYGSIIKIQ